MIFFFSKQARIFSLYQASCVYAESHNTSSIAFLSPLKFILLPLFVIRLVLSLSVLFVRSSYLAFFNIPHFLVLMRQQGYVSQLDSDYRFPFLTRALSLSGCVSSIYHGSYKPFLPHPFACHTADLFLIAEILSSLYYFFFPKTSSQQKLSLSIFISAFLLSLALNRYDRVFYWDYNIQHSPIYLAAWFRRCHRVGSIHAYHDFSIVPWCFPDSSSIHIKYGGKFISLSDFNLKSARGTFLESKSVSSTLSTSETSNLIDIVILEEPFAVTPSPAQLQLVYLIAHSSDLIRTVYLKPRPDRAFTDSYLGFLSSHSIKPIILDDIPTNPSNATLMIATRGSYPHDLSLIGHHVILVSEEPIPIDNSHNPIYLYHLNDFRSIIPSLLY